MNNLLNIAVLLQLVFVSSCASFYSKPLKTSCALKEERIEVSSSFYFDDFVSKREFDYVPKKSVKKSPFWDSYYKSFDFSLRNIEGIKDVHFVSVDEPVKNDKRYHMMFYFNDNKTTFDQAMYYVNNVTLGIIPFHKNYRGRLKVDVINKENKIISSHEFISEYDYYRSILLLPIGPFFPIQHAKMALRNDLVNKMVQLLLCK